jgi:3-hydroxyisobutyrate dehydrogenase-like beta-hydroxyacid dehydrogenase
MGGAITLRLLRAGYPMTVLDLDEAKMRPLTQEGAAASTIVLASLQSDAVEEVTAKTVS